MSKNQLRTYNVTQPVHVHQKVLCYHPHFKPSLSYYNVNNVKIDDERLKAQYASVLKSPQKSSLVQQQRAYREPAHDKRVLKFSYQP